MRERRKPFVIYNGGLLSFLVVPRGPVGWAQFAVWLALLGGLIGWFVEHVLHPSNSQDFFPGLILFIAGLAAWLVGGLWWMLARAELVHVVEIRRQKQYERWERERERRRRRDGSSEG